MLRADRDTAGPRHVFCNRLAQLGQALRRAVMRPTAVQRLFGRFDDVRRRGKIGLAENLGGSGATCVVTILGAA